MHTTIRNLVGFKSHGMVLCAAGSVEGTNGEKVEFIDPPAGAKPGDRIVALSLAPLEEPLSVKQCDKQKAFENVAHGLLGILKVIFIFRQQLCTNSSSFPHTSMRRS